ncbi:MAG: hypothetical protein KDA27_26490, partial [Candidatus Eisenbacteria bacterium]|nr:hypothetical protein [Candidatus Eisenbacteria bacterium]
EAALQEFASAQTRGRLLQISPRWSTWAFWVLAFTLLTGFAFVALVPIDRHVSGSGVVSSPGHLSVVFPAEDRERIEVGQTLWFLPEDGSSALELQVASVSSDVLSANAIRSRLGEPGERLATHGGSADADAFPNGGIMVLADIGPAAGLAVGLIGRADAKVGRRSLLRALTPGDAK